MLKKRTVLGIMIILLASADTPAAGRYIYYSKCPGVCEFGLCAGSNDTMYIFTLSPDGDMIGGAHFRLDVPADPGNPPSLSPGAGVTIESGDIFQGLTISWTPRDLDHYPLLAVHWGQPVYAWEYWVRDAMLFQTNGDTLFLPDAVTVDGHFDCFDLSFICRCPDTAEVLIDSPFDIEVTCFITAMGYIGTNIEINDERGWVTAWNPGSVEWNYCSICPWFKTYVMISGFVPASTPAHSVSRLTVYPTYGPFVSDSTSLYLKAIPSTGIKSTSWGAVKSRFMNGE